MNSTQQTPDQQDAARIAGRRWGAAIIGGLLIVVIVNFYVVWLVKDVDFPLVTESYYEDGLAYDTVIREGDQNRAHKAALHISPNGLLTVRYGGTPVTVTTAQIDYYRPDNSELDFSTPGILLDSGDLKPERLPAQKGRWNVTLRGTVDHQPITIAEKWYLTP